MSGRDRLARLDDLDALADEVVDVLQRAAADVEGVAAEARSLREDHAAGLRRLDLALGGDRVGAVADVRGHRLRDLGSAGVVGVARPRLRELRSLCAEDLDRAARLERQRLMRARLGPPERDQLLQLVRMLLQRGRCTRSGRPRCRKAPTSAGGSRPRTPARPVPPSLPSSPCARSRACRASSRTASPYASARRRRRSCRRN